MISYIRGQLVEVGIDHVVIETGGIGYYLTVPSSVLRRLPSVHSEVIVYGYLVAKEDELSLFGFLSQMEKQFFTTLITIPGIGPKTAISIMSKIEPKEFMTAVYYEDVKRLSSLPGIGKKTAQRLILELKDKLVDMDQGQLVVIPGTKDGQGAEDNRILLEVGGALESLGYRSIEYGEHLKQAMADIGKTASVEDYLKYVLLQLGR